MLLSGILFLVSYALYLLYLMHMFQLNTYKANEQRAWMRKNAGRLAGRAVLPVLAGACSLLPWRFARVLQAVLWALSLLFFVRRTPAKKPLVYTARVIRMLVTHAVLLAALLLAWHLTGLPAGPGLAVLYLALPGLILLANWLNQPIQKGINRHYINEARRKIRDMPDLKVIGITGSYGKTSVKFFLTELLSARYNVLCTPRNYNTELGVTRTIREDLNPTHQVFVCEMGARYVGDIKAICDIVHPQYGVITAIGPQHLDTFHSVENIVATKFELADSLPADGCMFLNEDNDYIRRRPVACRRVGFGRGEGAAFRLDSLHTDARGSRFSVTLADGTQAAFETDLIGEYNILDVLAAISVAYSLGVTVPELQRKVRRLQPVEHRLQLLPKNGRISVIDDAYNSNINGFNGALDTLALFAQTKVLVTPGMVELGDEAYALNFQAGAHAARVCDYIILVGKKQTQPLYDAVVQDGSFPAEHLIVVESLQEAWQRIPALCGGDMIVLLENDLPDNY